jgi:hypothetical protein
MRTDIQPAALDWTLAGAVDAIQDADLDLLPVVTDPDTFAGIVTLHDAIRLDQILHTVRDESTPTPPPGPQRS